MANEFGIFGPTPEQIRNAEQARRDQAFAQQAQGMGVYGPLYQASRRLSSRGVSRLGQSLFPQAQSPELQKAAALQQLKQKYTGVDLTNPNNMMKLAQDLSSIGAIEPAMAMVEQAKKLAPKKDIKTVDGNLVDITDVNNPKVLFTAPGKNIKAVGKSLIDLSDLSNPKVVFKDPEASLRTVGSSVIDFSKPYDPQVLYTDPNANVKTVGDSVIDFTNPKKPKVLFTKPEKPKIIETPTDMAGIAKYLGIPVKTNMDDYTQAEMQAIQTEVEKRQKQKEDAGSTGLQREKFNAEQREKAAKKEAALVSAIGHVNSMLTDVSEAKNLVSDKTAGASGLLKFFPETQARKLNNRLDTIKANLGFDRLQQMRDASPTGGALGQVAVQEINFLQATVAKLDQYESADDLKAALDAVNQHYNNWLEVVQGNINPEQALQRLRQNQLRLEAEKQPTQQPSGNKWRLLNPGGK